MTKKTADRMSTAELEQLLEKRRKEEQNAQNKKRRDYEKSRDVMLGKIERKVRGATKIVRDLFDLVVTETADFYEVMEKYGALRNQDQRSYKLGNDKFRIEVKHNKVKKFDERADIAATRLIEFLEAWIRNTEQGDKDPMYQLAMTLLERNRNGDLDYKSISKLYELEAQFNSKEYSEIMQLFKESNVEESSAINFYFFEKDERGVWRKLEPSFNRM